MDCLFCKISTGAIATSIIYKDDDVTAFNDITPQAPTHILIIPNKHIATVNDIEPIDHTIVGKLFQTAKKIAADQGFSETGYRLVMNCNGHAGQTVFHIHLHFLAGRVFSWPPG